MIDDVLKQYEPYMNLIKELFPNAKIIVDCFHSSNLNWCSLFVVTIDQYYIVQHFLLFIFCYYFFDTMFFYKIASNNNFIEIHLKNGSVAQSEKTLKNRTYILY